LSNSGTLTFNAPPTSRCNLSGGLTSTGAVNVNGNTFFLPGSGATTFANRNAFTVAAGATLTVPRFAGSDPALTLSQEGGTLRVDGAVSVGGGAGAVVVTLAGGAVTGGGAFTLNTSSFH